jgi:hypothetical protein
MADEMNLSLATVDEVDDRLSFIRKRERLHACPMRARPAAEQVGCDVAPGMKSDVNTCLKAGFSWPQPRRMSVCNASDC